MEHLISVIVPVYNVEKFLPSCIDSILSQTYKKLEILLVDDGSTDACPAICDAYAAKDDRVRVMHKRNSGVSETRNMGLDLARGDYLCFVDADDTIDEGYVENLYQMLREKDADVALCGWHEFFPESGQPFPAVFLDPEETQVWNREQTLKALLYQIPIDCAFWAKLYKRELFEGIRMTPGRVYEDMEAGFQVFERVDLACYNPYKGYRYLLRDNGIIRGDFSERKMDQINFVEEMKERLLPGYPVLEPAIWSRFFRANCHIYLQIPDGPEYGKYRRRIEENIVESRWKVLRDPHARKGTRIAALCTYLGFPFFRSIRGLKKLGKR